MTPNGLATIADFEYGLDARYRGQGASGIVYDQSTPAQQVGSDFALHPVSAPVTGLLPNAEYHVRLVAVNAAGSVTVGDSPHFWAAPFEQGDEFGGRGISHAFGPDAFEMRTKGSPARTPRWP